MTNQELVEAAKYVAVRKADAKRLGLEYDIDTDKLVPSRMSKMTARERDIYVRQVGKRQMYQQLDTDNDPGSPEQAWV